ACVGRGRARAPRHAQLARRLPRAVLLRRRARRARGARPRRLPGLGRGGCGPLRRGRGARVLRDAAGRARGVDGRRARPLPRGGASPAASRPWLPARAAGAAEDAAAGRAYFALESRTSLSVLRAASTAAALEDTQGVWRKLVQMLSGEPVVMRGVEVVTLRP